MYAVVCVLLISPVVSMRPMNGARLTPSELRSKPTERVPESQRRIVEADLAPVVVDRRVLARRHIGLHGGTSADQRIG